MDSAVEVSRHMDNRADGFRQDGPALIVSRFIMSTAYYLFGQKRTERDNRVSTDQIRA